MGAVMSDFIFESLLDLVLCAARLAVLALVVGVLS